MSDDEILLDLLGEELELAEAEMPLPRPTPIPRFAAETVRPGARS